MTSVGIYIVLEQYTPCRVKMHPIEFKLVANPQVNAKLSVTIKSLQTCHELQQNSTT